MTIVNLKTLLDHAQEHNYAIPAFNINFEMQVSAILDAAQACQSPVILQISSGGLKNLNPWMIEGLLKHIQSLHLPVCIHRDHVYDLKTFQQSLDKDWFSSMMIDGSICPDGKPRDLASNIEITNQAKKLLKGTDISIEGELGCLGSIETGDSGEEDGHQASRKLSIQELLTSPEQAAIFLEQAPVDALAIAIGTSHGPFKFSKPPTEQSLSIQQVKKLHRHLPSQHFVLHGCSSVAQNHLDAINQNGGNIQQTYGVPVDKICETIPFGVRKVNIDTDLRLGCTAALRKHLTKHTAQIDPRSYLQAAKDQMQLICINRFNAFGSSHKALLLMQSLHETTSIEIL